MQILPEIQSELEKAEQARRGGNEGQARVLARRAAGLAARRYLAQRGAPPPNASAYDVLHRLAADPALSPEMKDRAARLTQRVDEQFRLPAGVDLIEDARRLCEALLEGSRGEP